MLCSCRKLLYTVSVLSITLLLNILYIILSTYYIISYHAISYHITSCIAQSYLHHTALYEASSFIPYESAQSITPSILRDLQRHNTQHSTQHNTILLYCTHLPCDFRFKKMSSIKKHAVTSSFMHTYEY